MQPVLIQMGVTTVNVKMVLLEMESIVQVSNLLMSDEFPDEYFIHKILMSVNLMFISVIQMPSV